MTVRLSLGPIGSTHRDMRLSVGAAASLTSVGRKKKMAVELSMSVCNYTAPRHCLNGRARSNAATWTAVALEPRSHSNRASN